MLKFIKNLFKINKEEKKESLIEKTVRNIPFNTNNPIPPTKIEVYFVNDKNFEVTELMKFNEISNELTKISARTSIDNELLSVLFDLTDNNSFKTVHNCTNRYSTFLVNKNNKITVFKNCEIIGGGSKNNFDYYLFNFRFGDRFNII